MELIFTHDPAEFLRLSAAYLADDPVLNTVVATVAARSATERAAGIPGRPEDWYLTVRESSQQVVGVAMRSSPHPPHPLYLLPMPQAAAVLLARVLHDRGETTPEVNGALEATGAFAAEMARLTGLTVGVGVHTRLFEVREVVPPVPASSAGRLRRATNDDHGVVVDWFNVFMIEAAHQAGRTADAGSAAVYDSDAIGRRIEAGRVWLWEDRHGQVVHLSGCSAPEFGVQRLGPVYTPSTERGHGYASAAVAALSQQILDDGNRPCLFTDQANPTSNKIYQALGYEPVVDMISRVLG